MTKRNTMHYAVKTFFFLLIIKTTDSQQQQKLYSHAKLLFYNIHTNLKKSY